STNRRASRELRLVTSLVRMPPRLPALLAEPPRADGKLWLTGGTLFDGTGSAGRAGAAGDHDRPRRRLLRRHRVRGPPGDALRRVPRTASADLRRDRLRHGAGRP